MEKKGERTLVMGQNQRFLMKGCRSNDIPVTMSIINARIWSLTKGTCILREMPYSRVEVEKVQGEPG